jgi:Ca2+-binding EF-hand superfamily protein
MPSPLAQKIVNLQEIFNLFDKFGNDSVESTKIGILLRSAGLNPTEQAIQLIQSKQRA